MATARPWSQDEKNYLLAEIIKSQSPQPSELLNIIARNREIMWNDIPLPQGRSLTQCRIAFDELRRSQSATTLPNPLALQMPSPMSAPMVMKRPYGYEGSFPTAPTGREIRPKPSSLPGAYGPPPIEHPQKKKRGRPTKAEAQARAEAQGMSGEAGPAPRPPPGKLSIGGPMSAPLFEATTPVVQGPAEEARPSLPPVTRMPISSMLTPIGPKSASQSSSSSGKRRRGRSTRSEPEGFPQFEVAGAGQGMEYESPYPAGTAMSESHDTPARAAVLRHQNEPESESQPSRPPPPPPSQSPAPGPPGAPPDPDTT